MRWLLAVLLVFAAALVVASRFYPKVTAVDISGHGHYSRANIMALAGLDIGTPFLWITRTSAVGLLRDPWVAQATVVRTWPSHVSISVRERIPALTDGETTWAFDGTVLPGVTFERRQRLVQLEGWGPVRVIEALEFATMLKRFPLEVVSFSPEGFELQLSDGLVFTPSVDALRMQWAPVENNRGGRLAVYPWGVSRADD